MTDYIDYTIHDGNLYNVSPYFLGDAICRATDGKLYAVVIEDDSEDSGLDDLFLYKSSDDGETWEGPEVVIADIGNDDTYRGPSILCDGSGVLHVFAYDLSGTDNIFEVTRHVDSGSWDSPVEIRSGVTSSSSYAAAPGSGYGVWCAIKDGTSNIHIYKSVNTGVWTLEKSINRAVDDMDMAVDENGNVHLVWSKGSSGSAFKYANSFDGPWDDKLLFYGNGMGTSSNTKPRICITTDNQIHCVYPSGSSGPAIYFNFDSYATSGVVPEVTLLELFDTNNTIDNSLQITTDISDRIYISAQNNTTSVDVWMSETPDIPSSFVKTSYTPDSRYYYNRGSMSTLWPKVVNVLGTNYSNLPVSGSFLAGYYDSTGNESFYLLYDQDGSFPALFSKTDIDTSGVTINGFASGLGYINSQIDGILLDPAISGISVSDIDGYMEGGSRRYRYGEIHKDDAIYNSNLIITHSNNICRGRDGTLYVVLAAGEDIPNTIDSLYMRKSTDNGITWDAPELVLEDTGTEVFRYMNIICDADDTLHIIAFDDGPNEVFSITKERFGSWENRTVIETLSGIEELHAIPGDNNEIWLLRQYSNTTIGLKLFFFDGSSWDAGVLVDGTINSDNCDLSVDPSGNAHLLWIQDVGADGEIRYANSYDRITPDGNLNQYTINTDTSIDDGNSRLYSVATPNNKIHCSYIGDENGYEIKYFNFDVEASGVSPTIDDLAVITNSSYTSTTQNLVTIAADTNNRVYITTYDNNTPGEMEVWRSEDYTLFDREALDITTIPEYVLGRVATIWPTVLGVHINMPTLGLINTAIDTSVVPETLNIFHDRDSQFEALPTVTSIIGGYITGPQTVGSGINGFASGLGYLNSSISGYLEAIDDVTSSISGLVSGIGYVNDNLDGYLLCIGDLSGSISGIVGVPNITSTIFGFLGNVDVNSSIGGYVLAANDDQFINGFILTESGINSEIDGVVTGVYDTNSSISGITTGTEFVGSGISGYMWGDEFISGDVNGYSFGISGLINSSISGFIKSTEQSQINGYSFGISGIIDSSPSGYIEGHSKKTSYVNGLIFGFYSIIDPDCTY